MARTIRNSGMKEVPLSVIIDGQDGDQDRRTQQVLGYLSAPLAALCAER